jgi:hypothetical protein
MLQFPDLDVSANVVVEGIVKLVTALIERLPKKDRAAVRKQLETAGLIRLATDAEIKEYDPKIEEIRRKIGPAPKRRTMSVAARKRIAAAQKKRWAAVKQKRSKSKKRVGPKKKAH